MTLPFEKKEASYSNRVLKISFKRSGRAPGIITFSLNVRVKGILYFTEAIPATVIVFPPSFCEEISILDMR